MSYDTENENGETRKEKSPNFRKNWKRLLLTIGKRKIKNWKECKSYYSRWTRTLSTIRIGKGRAAKVEEMNLQGNWPNMS